MYDLFDPFRALLAIEPVSIDNKIFQLHYKATVVLLLAFSVLVTQKQYFGDPIDCITAGIGEEDFIDAHCWIQSTYTLLQNNVEKGIYAGVHNRYFSGGEHIPKYHAYYQWVTLSLYLQALMFYLPRYLWKIWEGGKMEMLVGDLRLHISDPEGKAKEGNTPHEIYLDNDRKRQKIKTLIEYFQENLNCHNVYAAKFIKCELLNFVNVIGQIYLTDAFVGYEFTTYGPKAFTHAREPFNRRHDPMEYVFPTVTKCDFRNYGPSGTPQLFDALCVLPVNIFNQKIYMIMWLWFMIVSASTAIGMLFRCLTFSPTFRQMLLQSRTKITKQQDIEVITRKLRYGDWFLLYQMAKNMEIFTLQEFISELAKNLQEERSVHPTEVKRPTPAPRLFPTLSSIFHRTPTAPTLE